MARITGFYALFIVCMVGYAPGFEQFYNNITYAIREHEPVMVPLALLFGFSLLFGLGFFAKSLIARIVVAVITFATCANELSYQLISGTGFGFNEANVVTREVEMAGSALSTFLNEVVISVGVAALTTALLFVFAVKWLPKIPTIFAILPVLVVTGAYLIVAKGGHNITYFPVTLRAPLNLYKAYTSPLYYGERDPVVWEPDVSNAYEHIVFLVDESVRGDKFSINGYEKETTPYLLSIRDQFINYGVSSSGANCSATSNILLQSGVQANQLPDTEHRTFKNPSIFQFAKKSGFKTYYLDGQTNRDNYINYMTKYDVEHIDNYVQTRKEQPGIEMHELDRAVADYVVKWVDENEHAFIYALKNGAHFHYEDGYPESETYFKPTVNKSNWNHDREQTENSYANVIKWSVDEFFRYLIPRLKGKNVLIVYTSDHGQGLMEDGNPSTHCMVGEPPSTQGNVPIMVVGSGDATQRVLSEFGTYGAANFGKATHFQLFPTLLIAMGYTVPEVSEQYGVSLLEPLNVKREFFSGDLWGRAHLDRNPFD